MRLLLEFGNIKYKNTDTKFWDYYINKVNNFIKKDDIHFVYIRCKKVDLIVIILNLKMIMSPLQQKQYHNPEKYLFQHLI